MTNNVSRIKTLYAYEDGDTITPRMGVEIAQGHGLQQFYDAQTRAVTNTDFRSFHPTLFPQPYSGRAGAVVEPASGGQWYLKNISDNNGILDSNGEVKAAYSSLFEVTQVHKNVGIFPGLVIKDNLITPQDIAPTDIYIFYVGSYAGKQFVCEQMIPVQAVVGNAYKLQVSVTGADGAGDEVLSSANDWIQYTAALQLMSTGTPIGDAVISFEHFGSNGWEVVDKDNNMQGRIVFDENAGTLTLWASAVDGSELYRAKAEYLNKTYYETLNPTDVQDPYYIVDGCSIAGDTVKRGETITFNPKIYKRLSGANEEDDCVYAYADRNASPPTNKENWDMSFTLVSQRDGNKITRFDQTGITYERLVEHGGIAVRIQATSR